MTATRHPSIDAVASEWDQFVPRDMPHLRAGFLRAVERGRVVESPAYVLVRRKDRLAAVALAYSVPIDPLAHAAPWLRQWVAKARALYARFLWRSMRVCGSPVSNAESGVYFDPQLSPTERREVFAELASEVLRTARLNQTLFFKEFRPEEVEAYAGDLEKQGFFPIASGAGTRLALSWTDYDGYVAAMRKRYRKLMKKDAEKGAGLEFRLLDSFAELGPKAAALYDQVFACAEHTVEKVTPEFFTAVSDFDQARLLVAHDRASGELLGVNLLLFGDTVMQNLFIGFDYARNAAVHLYFNLVEQSLRAALERGCKVCYLGQDSYEFKARLGAKPVPLTAYMKHHLWPVHALLRSKKEEFFPKDEAVEHDVFSPGETQSEES